MKTEVDIINATPSKRLYHSIIADYGLVTAISELIDNVIDSKRRQPNRKQTSVKITADLEDQSLVISDDAGGIAEKDLGKLITPGASYSDGQGASIGIFGVGSKRAAVALARDIKVATRHGRDKHTFLLEYDDSWLSSESWELPYYRTDSIPAGSTTLTFSRLRRQISEGDLAILRQRLGETFAKFIVTGELTVLLNEEPVWAVDFANWSYPSGFEPRTFPRTFTPDGRILQIKTIITSGLTLNRGSTASQYGVYVYCNDRLIVRAGRDSELGFHAGVAGVPHPSMANAQVLLEIIGPAADMPWNSSKTGLNYNHPVFQALQADIHTAVKNCTTLSKRFWPTFEESLAPFRAGNVIVEPLKPEGRITTSKLPPIPPANRAKSISLALANKEVAESKPWVVGAYESIEVVESLKTKKGLQQRNRIILIILDSMLEIAFKDYLAHDIPQPMSEAKLQALFGNRIDVQKEVEKTVLTGDAVWKKIAYFYKQRCELVHKRVSVSVSDQEIENFQTVAQKVTSKMFGLRFPLP